MAVAFDPPPYVEVMVDEEEYAKIWREAVGEEFKALRQDKTDHNQTEMSASLGWNKVQCGKLERGSRMALDYYVVYARALGVKLDEVFLSARFEVDRQIERRDLFKAENEDE